MDRRTCIPGDQQPFGHKDRPESTRNNIADGVDNHHADREHGLGGVQHDIEDVAVSAQQREDALIAGLFPADHALAGLMGEGEHEHELNHHHRGREEEDPAHGGDQSELIDQNTGNRCDQRCTAREDIDPGVDIHQNFGVGIFAQQQRPGHHTQAPEAVEDRRQNEPVDITGKGVDQARHCPGDDIGDEVGHPPAEFIGDRPAEKRADNLDRQAKARYQPNLHIGQPDRQHIYRQKRII